MKPEYCCNVFEAFVERPIFVRYDGKVMGYDGYDAEDYELDKECSYKQFKVCPFCVQPIKENKEYKQFEIDEKERQRKEWEEIEHKEFLEKHNGEDKHTPIELNRVESYRSDPNNGFLISESATKVTKCKYCGIRL
jgi:hypothetical protein